MQLTQTETDFLHGRKFSNGHLFRVGASRNQARNDLLADLARGKRVLHVGCADHPPIIELKRKHNNYLHDILTASASHVIGLDTNEEALDEM